MDSPENKETKDPQPAVAANLDQLILDRKEGKYGSVALISFRAKELRKLEENRNLTQTDLLERAICDVLGGKVSLDELEKQMLRGAAGAGEPEAKPAAEKPKKSEKEKDSEEAKGSDSKG